MAVISGLDSGSGNISMRIDTFKPNMRYIRRTKYPLRTLCSAEEFFYAKFDRYGTLDELLREDMLDFSLARATKAENASNGYYFRLTVENEKWSCVAMPAEPGKTGGRSFFINETGGMTFKACNSNNDAPADIDSSPLDGMWEGG